MPDSHQYCRRISQRSLMPAMPSMRSAWLLQASAWHWLVSLPGPALASFQVTRLSTYHRQQRHLLLLLPRLQLPELDLYLVIRVRMPKLLALVVGASR